MRYDLEIIEALWLEARDDFKNAKFLAEKESYSKVVYLCQQALEKLMKICLACEGIVDVKAHEITGLFGKYVVLKSGDWEERLKELGKPMRKLEREYRRLRYPLRTPKGIWIPSKGYHKEDALEALDTAEEGFGVIPKFLRERYNLDLE